MPHHPPPCPLFLQGIKLPLSTPCTAPLPLMPPKFLAKMGPLAVTITFIWQEFNFLPQNKTISELLCLDFQWISLLWTLDGGCRIQLENSCWVQERSFKIWLLHSLLLATLQINAARDLTFPGLHLSKPFLQQPENPPKGNFLPEPMR